MIVFQFSYKFFGLYLQLSLNPLTLMGNHDQDNFSLQYQMNTLSSRQVTRINYDEYELGDKNSS